MSNNNFGKIAIRNEISGNVFSGMRAVKQIISDTTAGWNSKPDYQSKKDTAYVYTDYKIVDGQPVPNIKIGDGNAYVVDLPFIACSDITPEQIAFWNNKVSCIIDPDDAENVIFSTN